MADPRNAQSASRLSEDIGDVLNAIRRMIAEDDALGTARERLIAERDALDSLVQEDAGEFLARRYGGNAALARRLAGITEQQVEEPAAAEEGWPFGERANAADAVRPSVATPAETVERDEQPRNDLARILSAGIAQQDRGTAADAAVPGPAANGPDAPRGWRAWVAPEPRPSRWAAPEQPEDTEADSFEALVAQNDFDEALDWKSRMRPDLDQVVAAAPADEIVADPVDEVPTAVAEQTSDLPEETAPAQPVPVAPVFSSSFAGYQALFSVSGLSVAGLDAAGGAPAGIWSLTHAGGVPATDAGVTVADAAMPEAAIDDDRADDSLAASAAVAAAEDADAPEAAALLLSDAAIVSEPAQASVAESVPAVAATVTGLAPEDEEASIRDLLREMIQEELHGELGERFSRNIRAVIRREVAAAIDAHLERF